MDLGIEMNLDLDETNRTIGRVALASHSLSTMGNVRMNTLPADRPVASHDCPMCVKRRVKCDRSEPACIKCASRKLSCPGFQNVYLKWDQGIASRGRFAGKSSPEEIALTRAASEAAGEAAADADADAAAAAAHSTAAAPDLRDQQHREQFHRRAPHPRHPREQQQSLFHHKQPRGAGVQKSRSNSSSAATSRRRSPPPRLSLSSLSPRIPPPSLPSSSPSPSSSSSAAAAAAAAAALTGSTSPTRDYRLTHSFLSTAIFHTLIHHFCTKAVSRLTWIDQPSHPWRTIVRTLLQNSPCLQLSVGSLAAAHLSMAPKTSSAQSNTLFGIYRSLRDESLRILSTKMQQHLQLQRPPAPSSSGLLPSSSSSSSSRATGSGSGSPPDHVAATAAAALEAELLASMLALCYAEVLVPGSLHWKVHLRACRAIIGLQHPANWQSAALPWNPVLKFLLKEISDLEVFAGTTTFDDDDDDAVLPSSTIALQSSNTVSGWAFTSLIADITIQERRRHGLRRSRPLSCSLPPVDMAAWHAAVDDAYQRTMTCPRLLSASRTQTIQGCFEALTRAYRNATLVYSYQALATDAERAAVVPGLVRAVIKDVHSIVTGPSDELFHDLSFPLFLAGAESASHREKQVLIEKLFNESMSRGGIWGNYSALQFLRTFWAAPANLGQHKDWIHFLRANLSIFGPFIVL
ncbi:Zn(2)-C6 fungal-type DNA-binding domain protein [Moelleriella libera RCEF 2490]|uniref:Zn(2)-C6 fungal-type DNA-binding domain protein n=1 Tax=Moelleriella libera RCEF 2490 TaxID=1081109 RepID=A0A168BI29_9HYPO|nr:Zn(2)-C6 fungal-type DNA-binding domain protein [Moelleriella libera RCEF 2490]